jgi:hypothetical protein
MIRIWRRLAALSGIGLFTISRLLLVKETLNKFRVSAAQGCAAIFNDRRSLKMEESARYYRARFSLSVL